MKRSVPYSKPLVKSSGIRDIPMNQRSLIIFHSAIKSEQTKKNYDKLLRYFRSYYIIKDFDSLLSIESKKLQTIVEDYDWCPTESIDEAYQRVNDRKKEKRKMSKDTSRSI